MSFKEISFLANWAKSNSLATKILSSKLSCTEGQIKELLTDLILKSNEEGSVDYQHRLPASKRR